MVERDDDVVRLGSEDVGTLLVGVIVDAVVWSAVDGLSKIKRSSSSIVLSGSNLLAYCCWEAPEFWAEC